MEGVCEFQAVDPALNAADAPCEGLIRLGVVSCVSAARACGPLPPAARHRSAGHGMVSRREGALREVVTAVLVVARSTSPNLIVGPLMQSVRDCSRIQVSGTGTASPRADRRLERIETPSKVPGVELADDRGVTILVPQPRTHRWTTVRKRMET